MAWRLSIQPWAEKRREIDFHTANGRTRPARAAARAAGTASAPARAFLSALPGS